MSLIRETDYGTPAAKAETLVTLTIDGQQVTVPEGTSLMRAAMETGVQVPKLCATDMMDAFGSCRLCVVEVEGRNGTPASCTTPVAEGMKVKTQTERLKAIRKGVMELYISDHPLDCLTCAANGDCELQDMAGAVGLRDVRYGYEGENHLKKQKDQSNPYFQFDPAKCIVCSRCVRACNEVQGTFALTVEGRGFDSMISAGTSYDDFLSLNACPVAPVSRPARPRRWRKSRSSRLARPSIRSSPPAPIAASAARSRRRCAAKNWCAWCPTRTARPIAATPASRAASRSAMRPTRTASSPR